ncbi:MAG: hypothetical protein ABI577_10705 [bacterium]
MKWIGRLFRKLFRLVLISIALTVVTVLLDALLSPDDARADNAR